MFVHLGSQHVIRLRHIDICNLSGCTVFFHIIYSRHNFQKKIIADKSCVLIFSTT
jgi:hypothetical protein